MGASISSTSSQQEANLFIAQQFSGTCDVSCQNLISNVNIDLINVDVQGDVALTQSCSTNANCLFYNTMQATADVTFKATNSSNASNAWSAWAANPFNFDQASSSSLQDIQESIIQASVENCNISSFNQMNNVSIFAANSNIGGSIALSQTGSTQGTCSLQNVMTAAETATAIATNTAQSGKDKKSSKFENKKSNFTRVVIYVIIAIVVIVALIIIGRVVTSIWGKNTSTSTESVSSPINKTSIFSSLFKKK